MPEHDWEKGRLAYDPYHLARLVREVSGYRGNHCDRCPGSDLCTRAYDRLLGRVHNRSEVYRVIALTRPFPCGLKPGNEEEVT